MERKEFFLGIDVSKGYADFALMDAALELAEPCFQLDDTNSGHEKLGEIIEAYFLTNPEMVLYCGLESTGGYERNWFDYFGQTAPPFQCKRRHLKESEFVAQ